MATIAAIASGDSNFSILVRVLDALDRLVPESDLIATLSDPAQSLTVFAPTDDAFGTLAVDLGFDGDPMSTDDVFIFLLDQVQTTVLNQTILYHVAVGALTAADIAAAGSVETLQGASIGADGLPTLTDQEPDILDPTLTATDIEADNGILHIIDRVLIPIDLPDNDAPTIAAILSSSGSAFDTDGSDFDILLAAVTAADLVDVFADADADFTVFAPNDAAFVSLAQILGFQGSGEAGALNYIVDAASLLSGGDPIGLLTDVLTYHVLPGSLQSSQVLAVDEYTTLLGAPLERDGTSLIDGEPDLPDAGLIALDILAANGIVHVIDNVLLPVDLLAGDGSGGASLAIGTGGADTFRTGGDTDFVDGKGGADTIALGQGDDVGFGSRGADQLFGKAGDDTLDGGNGRDEINGGRGNDLIIGGAGRDDLTGGRGADVFVMAEGKRDVVNDFGRGNDLIDASAFGLTFDDLTITGGHRGATVDFDGQGSVRIVGVEPDTLTADDFAF